MALRVGIVSAAHVHTPSYARCFSSSAGAELVGVWDDDDQRGKAFADAHATQFIPDLSDLLARVEAVAICSENLKHADHIEAAAAARRHIICEKPVAAAEEHLHRIRSAVNAASITFMTAFPCPFSPAFASLAGKITEGAVGRVTSVCATNRGQCPGGWFVDPALSGGGAMIDHVVHVADLLRRIFGCDPVSVMAQAGSNLYGQAWEDTAMVTLEFPGGVFATLDSSWSRTKAYKTWGDVTLNVVGEQGVIEADLFGQGLDVYRDAHRMAGTGSDLDRLMIEDFIRAVATGDQPKSSLEDGLAASAIALACYRSARAGQPAAVAMTPTA